MAETPIRGAAARGGPAAGGATGRGDRLSVGPGRVLLGLYAFFALAAGARAGWQLATEFHRAPVAYLLSALAAVIYLLAAAGLARGGPVAHRVVAVSCAVELAGVLLVGTASLLLPEAFPHSTVWSAYGLGYGFAPLVLPVAGLLWLRHITSSVHTATGDSARRAGVGPAAGDGDDFAHGDPPD